MSNINSDLLDEGLQAVMGKDRCQNEWSPAPKKVAPAKNEPVPQKEQPADASWAPVKEEGTMDKLKECAKSAILFGGISGLLFYWQQAGLLASSAAIPSLIACALAAGLSIGWNAK